MYLDSKQASPGRLAGALGSATVAFQDDCAVQGLVVPLQGHQGVVGNAVLLGNGCQRALLRYLRCDPQFISLLRIRVAAYVSTQLTTANHEFLHLNEPSISKVKRSRIFSQSQSHLPHACGLINN